MPSSRQEDVCWHVGPCISLRAELISAAGRWWVKSYVRLRVARTHLGVYPPLKLRGKECRPVGEVDDAAGAPVGFLELCREQEANSVYTTATALPSLHACPCTHSTM